MRAQWAVSCMPASPASLTTRPSIPLLLQVAHGSEPAFTWPSGIIAPLMDEGDPHCADYIYVWQAAGYELQVGRHRRTRGRG